LDDLDPTALSKFRSLWGRKHPGSRVDAKSDLELLEASELAVDGILTQAALILLGSRSGLGKHLPQAELIFEYRSSEIAGPAQDRHEYREGFLVSNDSLWRQINLRNDRQSYQDDFFRYDIPTFDEIAIREAILNAVCHRDYRHKGSVFIRQYSRRLEIISPGGLPAGVTVENIADQQNPRNRRLAEVLQRCGFIERSGQGVNLMIENAIRQTKPLPDFSHSSNHEVRLTLSGTVQNPAFIRFLEQLGEDQLQTFNTWDFLTLDALSRDSALASHMKTRLPRLLDIGSVESQGRGRGRRYFLSKELYAEMGSLGTYTRRKGLDNETNKALLITHLETQGANGSPISELCEVLPACSRTSVQRWLSELRNEGKVALKGQRRGARWFLISHTEVNP
jgi:ATP-dependent DNA helicase RecG